MLFVIIEVGDGMILIWYPKCSTCQKAKKFLDDHHCVYKLKDITIDIPTKEDLNKYISSSGKDIKKFFNTSGMKYREFNLKEKLPGLTEEEMINLLASDGMLIKRPILVLEDSALVGFSEKEWSEKI